MGPRDREDAPTLVCLAGLHGNEPAGVLALERVLGVLSGRPEAIQGEFIGVVGNRKALAVGRRYLDRDLNRIWRRDTVESLRSAVGPLGPEDEELKDLDGLLQEIIQHSAGRVFLLDIHTTSGPGSAFAVLDDNLPNREMALDLHVPLVLGLEEELGGTLTAYLEHFGVTVVGFEAGRHADPESVDVAEAAIWITLDSCDLIAAGSDRVRDARALLRKGANSNARIVEVRYRHHIEPGDRFKMARGFESFQPVEAGQELAGDAQGSVKSPLDGLLLMPLYQDQGEDGFFVVQEVRPAWLPISGALRRVRAERVFHLLPGVRKHPELEHTFVVDRRYARWLARQLFHLLGYRRQGKEMGQRYLTMVRRPDRD